MSPHLDRIPAHRFVLRFAMLAAKTVEECKALREQHHASMLARAKEKGVAMPSSPREDMCERMQARGRLK